MAAMLARFTRVLSIGTHGLRDRVGHDDAELLLRQAELELDLAEHAVRKTRAEAHARRLDAGRARENLIAQLADLDSHAHFALEQALEDLARDVMARQADLEEELVRLAEQQANAKAEARSADVTLVELQARRLALVAERAGRPVASDSAKDRSQWVQSMWRADRMIARALAGRSAKANRAQPWRTATKL
jgi:phage shock protein A